MTIWHMGIGCWISKATNTRSKFVILIVFHYNNGCTNAPECYFYANIAACLLSPFDSCSCPLPFFASCLSLFRFLSHSLFNFFPHPPLFILHLFTLCMAVPWLRRLPFCLWPRRVGFDSRPVSMGFVGRIAAWQVILLVSRFFATNFSSPMLLRFSASNFISPMLHTHSVTNHRRYALSNLTFRHRASCIWGQAFHYSPENAFYIFNQHINFIICYLLDRASLI